MVDACINGIDAPSTGRGVAFSDDIAYVVNIIDVRAVAAGHRVCTGAAIEGVVASRSCQRILPGISGYPVCCAISGAIYVAGSGQL